MNRGEHRVAGRNLLWMFLVFGILGPAGSPATAQSDTAAEPVVGLRDTRPRCFALQGATVVTEPGQSLADATVLIKDSAIVAVGQQVEIPAGCLTIDCGGKWVYPGLIDAYSEIDVPRPEGAAPHWNEQVTPHRQAAQTALESNGDDERWRGQGITVRVVAPRGGIVKGGSCVVLTAGESGGRRLLTEAAWQHLQLTVPRGPERPRGYPNSPMGAVALLRQTFYDADWYRRAWAAYHANATLPRPETNVALATLADFLLAGTTFVIDAPNERMAIRGGRIAEEFSLAAILRGSGREYRRLEQIRALNLPVLVPVNFPKPPDVSSDEGARNTTLQELLHWQLAPENPGRLAAAGVTLCLTTDGLDQAGDFLKQVRKAVDRGLDPTAALAALTTNPARLLNLDQQLGRLQPGMLANLVITDGELFATDTKLLETWVAGQQFVKARDRAAAVEPWLGRWRLESPPWSLIATLKSQDGQQISGQLQTDPQSEQHAKLQNVSHDRVRLNATVKLAPLGEPFPDGMSRLTLNRVGPSDPSASPSPAASDAPSQWYAKLTLPDGELIELKVSPAAADPEAQASSDPDASVTAAGDQPEPQAATEPQADAEPQAATEPQAAIEPQVATEPQAATDSATEPIPLLFPLGAYGLEQPLREQPTVLFRDATVWTCGPEGILEQGDVLISGGLIAAVGIDLQAPEGCQIVDARGKHLSPGMIDCHSHIASDGGINESGQAVTAEVRIGDFIDNSDIAIYRQLAGGTTTSNILHGSANPIGGQNQVLKFRWGETMDGLRMKQAPPGIKFALGENVKRNTSRYPNTRMGVEQIIRDQLLAAREYRARWKRWRDGRRDELPPRRDLQLDAIAEVQTGERWIHCHSYRQDEIVATLDLLDEFGVRIGTLQHILEGYKVADRMAAHGAGGSSFSDWWAYKFEVFDAIPHNGALMHQQGIVVSFNSDDAELGRRLNTEAAKATKYGGVPEIEALKFVTLNPAKQLRIDSYVGSLEVGKHADLVLWSGRPLSTLSRCEQTWIDGRRYFSLEQDQQLRDRDRRLRNRLIQAVLATDEKPGSSADQEQAEEDRWLRFDAYCRTHDRVEYEADQ